MSTSILSNINTDGLVYYLDCMNQKSYSGSGTASYDLVSNLPSILTNGVSSDGRHFLFDGVNDYIIHDSIDLGTVCSWGIWFNFPAISGMPVLLGANIGSYYSLFWYGDYFYVNFGGIYSQISYSLSANTWYNVFMTRNGANINLYVDGSFIGTMTNSSYASLPSLFSIIGAQTTSAFYSYVEIANCLLYNKQLTSAEVLQNFNATKTKFE
jgi:hypothetical protein